MIQSTHVEPAGIAVNPKKKRSAFRRAIALLEVILAIVVLAIVGVRVYQNFAEAQNSQTYLDFQSMLGSITGGVQNAFLNSPGYGTAGTVITSSVVNQIPRKYTNGGNIRSPYGHNVTITVDTTDTNRYVVSTELSAQECVKIGQADLGRTLEGLSINSTDITLPADAAAVRTACGATGNVTLAWTFR